MSDVRAPFRGGDGPIDSHPSLPAAAAAVAVADPAQPVAAESCIGASDRDAEYGDGVERCLAFYDGIFQCQRERGHDGQHRYTSSADGRSASWDDDDGEHTRQSRLSRWQEQR